MNSRQATQDVDFKDISTKLASLDIPQSLLWISEVLGQKVAFASSFGLEDQVLTDLIARHAPAIGIFTIDTGRLPQETHELIQTTRQRYAIQIEVLTPDPAEVQAMVAEHGQYLFYDSVANRKLCCHVRKVNVLRRKLAGLSAWICGLRREQSVTRADIGPVEWDAANGLTKINPLVDWSTRQVWDYIRANDVPYNALHDQGYPSIGCAPCTRAVADGEDIRAGRWWWEAAEHKECGLHVVDGRLVRKAT